MEISSRYNPSEIEDKWYAHWESKGYFHSEPDERESYSIVIPPPNVTGVLHMGHMLNNTIQDVLIRKARLDGKNACWVPGTDHASIATEAKVVRLLREQGIKKSDLSREEFLAHAWEWKEKYGGIILKQLRRLGASCDWERTSFTMDETRSDAVIKAFVDLYNKGKLYRGLRMVNWDPEAQTVLSNEEVLHNEENGHLYHVKYLIEGTEEYITIATTRPETILGDSAVAVHPEDERYQHLRGKNVIVPLVNRVVPIIFDDYVTMDFGTGALKVTPAHDVNDYELGKKHELETIDVFNANGTISEAGQLYIGEDRFAVRKMIKKDLDAAGSLVEVENYRHSIGRSERTNAVVEPRLSLQWYVNMESLAKPALEAVMSDEVCFYPSNQKNLYKHWMENIRDWCISRQLWWGHRIPAWFYKEDVFVAINSEEALAQAKEKYPEISMDDLKQDEDVLDTWFSSWLWPISVFDGFNDPKTLAYYYPTSVLVTGWDIIFLWVARMVMAGYEWEEKRPFKHVYFTGMVRDQKRRKMSKSLGNSPDALKLIDDFGADGVRFGMLSCSPAGGDLLFDEKLCEQGRNFCNKIWNALRLIKGWEVDDEMAQSEINALSVLWIEEKLKELQNSLKDSYSTYRLSEAMMNIYSFVWNDFCSWYLEMIKPAYGAKIDQKTLDQSLNIFSKICTVLHPFMPFITEEVWHTLKTQEGDCMMSLSAKEEAFDKELLSSIEGIKELVGKIRDLRNQHGIKMKEKLDCSVVSTENVKNLYNRNGVTDTLIKLANLGSFSISEKKAQNGIAFVSGADEYVLDVELDVDIDEAIAKAEEELAYQKGFLNSVMKKLSNERFVQNAPEQVVAKEKQKQQDAEDRIKILEQQVKDFKAKT